MNDLILLVVLIGGVLGGLSLFHLKYDLTKVLLACGAAGVIDVIGFTVNDNISSELLGALITTPILCAIFVVALTYCLGRIAYIGLPLCWALAFLASGAMMVVLGIQLNNVHESYWYWGWVSTGSRIEMWVYILGGAAAIYYGYLLGMGKAKLFPILLALPPIQAGPSALVRPPVQARPPAPIRPPASAQPPVFVQPQAPRPVENAPIFPKPVAAGADHLRWVTESPERVTRIQQPEAPPTLAWVFVTAGPAKGQQYTISRQEALVGRGSDCDICIEDEQISRRHAKLVQQANGSFLLVDMASANGVQLNGQKVYQSALADGDEISLGDTLLVFKAVESKVQTEEGINA